MSRYKTNYKNRSLSDLKWDLRFAELEYTLINISGKLTGTLSERIEELNKEIEEREAQKKQIDGWVK